MQRWALGGSGGKLRGLLKQGSIPAEALIHIAELVIAADQEHFGRVHNLEREEL